LLFNKTTFVCSFSPALTLLKNYTSNADLQEREHELKFEKTEAQEEKEMHREREAKERTRLLTRSLAARLRSWRTLRERTMEKKSAAATFCAESQQDTTRAATKDIVEYLER
jgi:hypothetical protein